MATFTDTFVRGAYGTIDGSTTSDGNTTWTLTDGPMVTASPGLVRLTTGDTEGSAAITDQLASTDMAATITMSLQAGSGFGEWTVWARYQNSSNFYAGGIYFNGSQWELYLAKVVGGVFTALDTPVEVGSSTPAAGTTITLTCDGTSISLAWSGGAQTLSATDSSLTTGRYAAIYSYYYSGTAPALTNFTVSDLAGADDLTADDIESASELTSPAMGQTHIFAAGDVESTSELSSPAVGQVHTLLADDVVSASELSSPAMGQTHALAAENVESTSELTPPALGQTHALQADDIESASELTSPALSSGGAANLGADDIESLSELSTPSLGQVHVLTANDIESASELTSPALNAEIIPFPTGGGGGSRGTIYEDRRYFERQAKRKAAAAAKLSRPKKKAEIEKAIEAAPIAEKSGWTEEAKEKLASLLMRDSDEFNKVMIKYYEVLLRNAAELERINNDKMDRLRKDDEAISVILLSAW